jgi:hypothetical protein
MYVYLVGNEFEVTGIPHACVILYVISPEAVRVVLDTGHSMDVPVHNGTRIGKMHQSAAKRTEGHTITITRVSNGVTKKEPFSVCVHRSLYT